MASGFDPSWIEVTALDEQGKTVGQAWVADASVNVQEKRGTVILDDWSVVVAVPLTRRAMRLAVSPPGNQFAPGVFDVQKVSRTYCKQYPGQAICNGQDSGKNPQHELLVNPGQAVLSNPPEQ